MVAERRAAGRRGGRVLRGPEGDAEVERSAGSEAGDEERGGAAAEPAACAGSDRRAYIAIIINSV